MKKRKMIYKMLLSSLLLFLLTGCSKEKVDEKPVLSTETVKDTVSSEEDDDNQSTIQDREDDVSNSDILAASSGITIEQTLEGSAGKISIEAQIDVDGVSRVSLYNYLPVRLTEEHREKLLSKMFPAESWNVNEAITFNEQKNTWEFVTPRKESWVYQTSNASASVSDEQIFTVTRVDLGLDYTEEEYGIPIQFSREEDVSKCMDALNCIPNEIDQIGKHYISSLMNDVEYCCSAMYLCGEEKGDPFAKAIYKRKLDGMPVTGWNDFTTITSAVSPFPIYVRGSIYSVEEIGLEKTILTPAKAVEALKNQMDSIQMQKTNIRVTKISLEYLTQTSSNGAPEIVPIWRFWPEEDEPEESKNCELIFAVNAVSGDLIWEERNISE